MPGIRGKFVSRKEQRKRARQEKKQRRNWKEHKAAEKKDPSGRDGEGAKGRKRKRPRKEGGDLESKVGANFMKILQENQIVSGYRAPEDDEIEMLERKLGLNKGKGKDQERELQRGLNAVGLGALGHMVGDIEGGRLKSDAKEASAAGRVGGDPDEDGSGESSGLDDPLDALADSDLDAALLGGDGLSEDEEAGGSATEGDGVEDAVGVSTDTDDEGGGGGGVDEEGDEDLVTHRTDLYGRDVAERRAAAAAAAGGAASGGSSGGKYVPPHMRAARGGTGGSGGSGGSGGADTARLEGLRRRVRGQLNRLGEDNVEPIALAISAMYAQHPRRDVNEVVADAAVALVSEGGASAFDAVCRLVAGLVAALHVLRGPEVGAPLLERFAREFRAAWTAERGAEGADGVEGGVAPGGGGSGGGGGGAARTGARREPSRRASSLLLVLGYLYAHGMVHSDLVYDLVRLLASPLGELGAELLLLLLGHVGYRLRGESAQALLGALQEIEGRAAEAARAAGAGGVSVRTQVMLDAIAGLRSNRRGRQDEELVARGQRLAKWLRRLRAQRAGTGGADAQLRVGWNDLMQAEERGRWWIPGARFVGGRAPRVGEEAGEGEGDGAPARGDGAAAVRVADAGEDAATRRRLEALARRNHMNTDVRRSVFVALMGASNFEEAVERIAQLGLREVQEREVARVLLHCCGQERAYNPFYAHVAERLAGRDARARFTLQLCFWDAFKMLPSMSARRGANLARMLAQLVARDALSLAVLKPVEFSALSRRQVLFFRAFFAALLASADEKAVQGLAVRLGATKALGVVRDGATVFLRMHMGSTGQDKAFQRRSRLLLKTLDQVARLASTV